MNSQNYAQQAQEAAEQARWPEAVALMEQALQNEPDNRQNQILIGEWALKAGAPQLALVHLNPALKADPYDEWVCILTAQAVDRLGHPQQAIKLLEGAAARSPLPAEAFTQLGLIYQKLGQNEAAIKAALLAVEHAPYEARYLHNLGQIHFNQAHFEGAKNYYRRALAIDPQHLQAPQGLALSYRALGQVKDGRKILQRGLMQHPAHLQTQLNAALFALYDYDYQKGWREFEVRRKMGVTREGPQSIWKGETRQEILCFEFEQGFGDTLQFVRYLKLAKDHARTTEARVQPRLLPLLSHCLQLPGNIHLSAAEYTPSPKCSAPLLSLPHLLKNPQPLSAQKPYLKVPEEWLEKWRPHFASSTKKRIGIVWHGNPQAEFNHHRSIPLEELAYLAEAENIEWVCLQHGPEADLAHQVGFPFMQLPPLDEEQPFVDTAAVMCLLDEVWSVDTVSVHLAGALGVKTQLFLGSHHDWRWGKKHSAQQWYPSVNTHYQRPGTSWRQVLEKAVSNTLQNGLRLVPKYVSEAPSAVSTADR